MTFSNAIPPSVTPPSPFEWPNTILTITGISKDSQAKITCVAHPFTSSDIGVTSVMPLLVKGMLQINGLPGVIQSIVDADNFTVNINSSNFFTYQLGGQLSILTGVPPSETIGFQTFNRPFHNIANGPNTN